MEYYRTDKGVIIKAKQNHDLVLDLVKFWDCTLGNIIKHSKDIIDLIEVGDIITYTKWGEKTEKVIDVGNKCVGTWRDTIYEDELISILTHEQYEKICYKVGED